MDPLADAASAVYLDEQLTQARAEIHRLRARLAELQPIERRAHQVAELSTADAEKITARFILEG